MDFTSLQFSDDHLFSDVMGGTDDWFGSVVNASDLTDFPDDFITQSLAAFSGRDDDDDLQVLMPERASTRSTGMRSSFSMNDLGMLQQHATAAPAWNHMLVSVKPKLESVPEGSPSNGGPLNLLPLTSTAMPGSRSNHMHMPLQLPPLSGSRQSYPAGPEGTKDMTSSDMGGLLGSLPSAGTQPNQLQLTHVNSETQLPNLEGGGAVAGSTAAAVNAFRFSDDLINPGDPYGDMVGLGPPELIGMEDSQHMDEGQGQHDLDEELSAEQQQQQPRPPGQRPSALPLRKSQSAVELGSWRSFVGEEEFWDMQLPGIAAKVAAGGAGGSKLSVDDRVTKLQRHNRDKRTQRTAARTPKAPTRKPGVADMRPARVRVGARPSLTRPSDEGTGAEAMGSGDSLEQNALLSSGHTSSGGGTGQAGDGMQGAGQCATSPRQTMRQQTPVMGRVSYPPHLLRHKPQPRPSSGAPPLLPSQSTMQGFPSTQPMQGIHMIGASSMPSTLSPNTNPFHLMGHGTGAMSSSWGNTSTHTTFPTSLGPSAGGIFSGSARAGAPGAPMDLAALGAGTSMMLGYSHHLVPPCTSMQYMGGQTIFSGSMLTASCLPGSASGSAQPSLSPPPKVVSPAHTSISEAHSESHSVGHGMSL